MVKFIPAVSCPNCDCLIKANGMVADYTVNEPIINLTHFENTKFECSHCGTKIYVGDSYSIYEIEDGDEDKFDDYEGDSE